MADVLKNLNLLDTLKESMDTNKLSDVKNTIEDLLISRVNIGILGDRNLEKTTFMNSLRGLGASDEGAAVFPSTASPKEVAGFPDPKHTDFRLWDLPPVPIVSPFEPESFMDKSKFVRYNAVFITFTESLHVNSVKVFLEARSAQIKTVYFVLLASDKVKTVDDMQKASLEVQKAQGVAVPKVYCVNPSCLEKLDFPTLLEDMCLDLPEIRAHALLLALPILTSVLVNQKKEAFKAMVWAAASLSGGISTLPVPFVSSMVDSSVGVRILSKAQLSLCLDNKSVERLARSRGIDPTRLKALRTCSLSVEVLKSEVKKRLAAAEKELLLPSTLVGMAMPKQARSAGKSFSAMLQALNTALDEMAADAEKIVEMIQQEGQ